MSTWRLLEIVNLGCGGRAAYLNRLKLQMLLMCCAHAMSLHTTRSLMIMRRLEPRASAFCCYQETFTSMDFGFTFSDLGRCTFKTPSLYSALTLLPSASSGRVKLRIKLP
jgi:hypothetical protein